MAVHKFVSIVSCGLMALALVACSSEESASASEQASQTEPAMEMPAGQPDEPEVPNENVETEEPIAESTDTTIVEPDPTPVEEAAAEADPQLLVHDDGLPEGLGKEEFERICSDCHAVATAIGTRRSQDEWGVVIQEMRDMGADASNIEAGLILAYLSQNFGT